jgi:hypothetical protein
MAVNTRTHLILTIQLSNSWDIFFYYWWGGTKSVSTAATSGLLYKPQIIDEDDCGAIGGIKIGTGETEVLGEKPAPAPLFAPQIPHDQTRARTPGRRGGKPATNRLSYGAAFPGTLFNLFEIQSSPPRIFCPAPMSMLH